jgi:hypothetical protein
VANVNYYEKISLPILFEDPYVTEAFVGRRLVQWNGRKDIPLQILIAYVRELCQVSHS